MLHGIGQNGVVEHGRVELGGVEHGGEALKDFITLTLNLTIVNIVREAVFPFW